MLTSKRNVQFHYMQDQEQPLRVLTVATEKLGTDNFRISYAINRVEKVVDNTHYRDDADGMMVTQVIETVAYDPFNKSLARKVAGGRLVANKHTLEVKIDGSVRDSVLLALANSRIVPLAARRIAEQQLGTLTLHNKSCEVVDGRGTD